ncbi:hypothetical protein ACP70R_010732 [Stipagrostis hirtigluma subsp. patula]
MGCDVAAAFSGSSCGGIIGTGGRPILLPSPEVAATKSSAAAAAACLCLGARTGAVRAPRQPGAPPLPQLSGLLRTHPRSTRALRQPGAPPRTPNPRLACAACPGAVRVLRRPDASPPRPHCSWSSQVVILNLVRY